MGSYRDYFSELRKHVKEATPQEVQEQALLRDEADEKKRKLPDQGSIFLGTEGIMVLPHIARPRLVGEKFKDYTVEEVKGTNHWFQFIGAVRGEIGEDGKPMTASAVACSKPPKMKKGCIVSSQMFAKQADAFCLGLRG